MKKKRRWLPWVLSMAVVCIAALAVGFLLRSPAEEAADKSEESNIIYVVDGFRWVLSIDGLQEPGSQLAFDAGKPISLDIGLAYMDDQPLPDSEHPYSVLYVLLEERGNRESLEELFHLEVVKDFYDSDYIYHEEEPAKKSVHLSFQLPQELEPSEYVLSFTVQTYYDRLIYPKVEGWEGGGDTGCFVLAEHDRTILYKNRI